MRLFATASLAIAIAIAAGCGGSSNHGPVSYREPGEGWTANIPAGWTAVGVGPVFVRGDPLTDPTRLFLETLRDRSPAAALREVSDAVGIRATAPHGDRAGEELHWKLYRGSAGTLAAELALAKDGADTHVAALAAPRTELDDLVDTVLLPAVDSFAPGPPQTARSVLATAPPAPAYWPTTGWRTASPKSQGIDGKQLDAMVAEIRNAKLPIDSVTVIRHGYVVLDQTFGKYAAGKLPEPYATGRLHELQSATKSVVSLLAGIALEQNPGLTVQTPLARFASAVGYVPAHNDARKQAITLEDLLTMQSGLAWKEAGYAYKPGSGNDVMKMLQSRSWTGYTIDRPMAATPGTTYVYNTGGAHLVSAMVQILTKQTAAAFAAKQLFAPLGIHTWKWQRDPEGISAGGFGLALQPRDLAKLAFLALHQGRWDGRQIVPAAWVRESTTAKVADPRYQYGYLWWLDRVDGYAYMSGLYGQFAVAVPGKDVVVVMTAHIPAAVDASTVERWLLEHYVLPAAG